MATLARLARLERATYPTPKSTIYRNVLVYGSPDDENVKTVNRFAESSATDFIVTRSPRNSPALFGMGPVPREAGARVRKRFSLCRNPVVPSVEPGTRNVRIFHPQARHPPSQLYEGPPPPLYKRCSS